MLSMAPSRLGAIFLLLFASVLAAGCSSRRGTGTTVAVSDDPAAATARSEEILVSCPICAGVGAGPGC
jgi:predicted small secreted protein